MACVILNLVETDSFSFPLQLPAFPLLHSVFDCSRSNGKGRYRRAEGGLKARRR